MNLPPFGTTDEEIKAQRDHYKGMRKTKLQDNDDEREVPLPRRNSKFDTTPGKSQMFKDFDRSFQL